MFVWSPNFIDGIRLKVSFATHLATLPLATFYQDTLTTFLSTGDLLEEDPVTFSKD